MNLYEALKEHLTVADSFLVTNFPTINGITFDSRKVKAGDAFFAISGFKQDGLSFVNQAVENGASIIVSAVKLDNLPSNVSNFIVKDVRHALAAAAKNFYNDPSSKLQLFSVTGTNGKTSVAWIFAQLASLIKNKSMYIGTLGVHTFLNGRETLLFDFNQTSPDPLMMNSLLDYAIKNGISVVSSEVTSVGLTQYRTKGINWNCAAFTNLTQDHLDYHGTMESYGDAKSRLFFEELKESNKDSKTSVINIDDKFGAELFEKINKENFSNVLSISTDLSNISADLSISDINTFNDKTIIKYNLKGELFEVSSVLLGSFNISNLTVAIAALASIGFRISDISRLCSQVRPVPGRMENVNSRDGKKRAFIDYSHTPDSLIKAQLCLTKILDEEFLERSKKSFKKGRLITIFGCGGDRDKTKRPIMAREVENFSDFAIVTSDNPRTENPNEIINDILKGFSSDFKDYLVLVDRLEAIKKGIELLEEGDILLIAGKGHENYQEINGIKYDFDDKVMAREFFKLQVEK